MSMGGIRACSSRRHEDRATLVLRQILGWLRTVGIVDLAGVSEAVALMAATGAISGVSEDAALEVIRRLRERVRGMFEGDPRAMETLTCVVERPEEERKVRELAAALAWYAERDEGFLAELVDWANKYAPATSGSQNVWAGRDAYTAGRDLTVSPKPDLT